jgi:thiol-disulfide isomerase/thioredoxin
MKALRPISIWSVLLVALQISALAQSPPPNLSFKDIRGRRIRLSDYKGKVVLLNFWATWCPPCRTEMPDLIKLQTEYRGQGLRIIGITYPPQTLSKVRRLVRKIGVNYPITLGKKPTKALFDKSDVLPITVIIDREGNVRGVVQGILYPEEFEEKIRPLLRSSAQSTAQ